MGYRDLKKDQTYLSQGTLWSVSAGMVYVLQDLNSSPTISTVDLQGMPSWGCWQLKVLQWLEKITTGIRTGDLLIHWCTGHDTPTCKEFLGLLPKPLYQSPACCFQTPTYSLKPVFNTAEDVKVTRWKSELCSSTFPFHDIQLVVNTGSAHWQHHPTVQHCPSSCGLQSLRPTECHAEQDSSCCTKYILKTQCVSFKT